MSFTAFFVLDPSYQLGKSRMIRIFRQAME